jgi:hypothetical protein
MGSLMLLPFMPCHYSIITQKSAMIEEKDDVYTHREQGVVAFHK